MPSLEISRYSGAPADWDDFVRSQSGWSHFHLYGWRTVIERVFRHECIYLVAKDSTGRLAGVLPLVRVRSLIFGHLLVSMPFLNYGGPLGSDEAIVALVGEAEKIATQSRARVMELRARRELPIGLTASHRKITVLLDMPDTPDAAFKALPAKLRSQVRRPQKEGITVSIGPDQLDAFYNVFAHHMRDLGTPVLPRKFFATAREVFPDTLIFAAAYHQGQAVACGCGFLWGNEFEISWASSLRSHNNMSPNMLVYWELMSHVIERGARIFNFGRCTRGSGTHKFKMQWGGREEQLWWYRAGAVGAESEEGATPSQQTGLFGVASRAWQRLPLPITTRLGPAIVRFIP